MNKDIGERLKYLRNEHKFTQKEVGDFLGISQSQLAKIEKGKRNLDVTTLDELCDLYNVPEEFIVYGDESYDIHQSAFCKNNKQISLETIAKMNRIVNNIKFMEKLKEKNR